MRKCGLGNLIIVIQYGILSSRGSKNTIGVLSEQMGNTADVSTLKQFEKLRSLKHKKSRIIFKMRILFGSHVSCTEARDVSMR